MADRRRIAADGTAAGVTNIHILSWCQQRVETTVRGRVMSVLMLASLGLTPVSLAFAGVRAGLSGRMMFPLAGGATTIVAAASARGSRVREIA